MTEAEWYRDNRKGAYALLLLAAFLLPIAFHFHAF